jgi:hypothetical protein
VAATDAATFNRARTVARSPAPGVHRGRDRPARRAARGLGFTPVVPQPGDVIAIEVRAAPWIPVREVRAITSRGAVTLVEGLVDPADPFGTDGVVRWRGEVALTTLLGPGDDWLSIEAGLAPPPYADLDDDGVPDTGDNDGDGAIDADDIEDDEDTGPIANPPDPTDPADPRFIMTRIVPESWPYGFTNFLLIDVDGGGWIPPGGDR